MPRFYGLSLYFPEHVKLLKGEDYDRRASTVANATYADLLLNTSIENANYVWSTFHNVRFEKLILNHVLFDGCHFDNVSFVNVKSSQSLFRNSTLSRCQFVDTDLFPYRFDACQLSNTSFTSMDAFCPLDFDYNIHLGDVFLEHLVGEVALIPGFVAAACFIDRFGRVRIIGNTLAFVGCSSQRNKTNDFSIIHNLLPKIKTTKVCPSSCAVS